MDQLDVIFERKNVYDRQSWYNESAPIFNNLEILDEDRDQSDAGLDLWHRVGCIRREYEPRTHTRRARAASRHRADRL